MNRHKRKPVPVNPQIARLQLLNEYLHRMQHFCDIVSNPEVFRLIPLTVIKRLLLTRFQTIKVIAAQGHTIDKKTLDDSRKIALGNLKTEFDLEIAGVPEISLQDIFTVGFTLMLHTVSLKDEDYPGAAEVKKALKSLTDIYTNGMYEKLWNRFNAIATTLNMFYSDLDKGIHIFKSEMSINHHGRHGMFFLLEVYCMQTEEIHTTVEGKSRLALRVGWGFPDPVARMEYISIRSEDVNLPAGKLLNVYVQIHALDRLSERMDTVPVEFLHHNLFLSLVKPKICKNRKDGFLFEFSIYGIKAGYMVGCIVDGRIILRTFLFITNSGTPEGDKLRLNTGLMKEDMDYLHIDKLSAFVHSDIITNDSVRKIFADAGCDSIFNIDEMAYIFPNGITHKEIAGHIEDYLHHE